MKKEEPKPEDIKNAETIDMRNVDPLAGLPEWLKHPRSYKKVEAALLEQLSCKKSHSDPYETVQCQTCQDNLKRRRLMMMKFGFKSLEQFMQWRKVHEEIKKYVSKDDYERMLKT